MNKILKYQEYDSCAKFWKDFAELIVDNNISESKNEKKVDESEIIKISKQLSKDLKFNLEMVFTFGTGISAMYPIVEHLIKNSSLTGLTLTPKTIVLLTITAISIAYLEINKNKPGATEIICSVCDGLGKITRKGVQNLEEVDEKENCHNCHGEGKTNSVVTKKDAQTLLFECRQRGAGKGIITKLANCLISIGDFVIKGFNFATSSLIGLFAYTAILVPIMNAISALIDQNNSWTLDNLPQILGNLLSLGVGALSFLIKRGWDHLASRLSNFFKKVPKNQGDIVDTTWNPDNLENQDIIKERGK
jgi:hypothetical protein